ncbi:MAG: hypothetical protein BJ554DRAFT_6481 [Olpidium bornovanus]|uniref:Uncharacterized protein n=1 Tax=Olpidium bornovanus TaxID=278681 RepID=A0A8H7ZXV6_9FUNG|nr:MAG: hypothetical protein BJ554DRAFT_6481 [Olpidium bornovanus]
MCPCGNGGRGGGRTGFPGRRAGRRSGGVAPGESLFPAGTVCFFLFPRFRHVTAAPTKRPPAARDFTGNPALSTQPGPSGDFDEGPLPGAHGQLPLRRTTALPQQTQPHEAGSSSGGGGRKQRQASLPAIHHAATLQQAGLRERVSVTACATKTRSAFPSDS